jgi:hypothetical protein
MQATLSHIGLNLSSEEKSFPFWKDLITYLGFKHKLDGNHFEDPGRIKIEVAYEGV